MYWFDLFHFGIKGYIRVLKEIFPAPALKKNLSVRGKKAQGKGGWTFVLCLSACYSSSFAFPCVSNSESARDLFHQKMRLVGVSVCREF
jgi:hypothetical protein